MAELNLWTTIYDDSDVRNVQVKCPQCGETVKAGIIIPGFCPHCGLIMDGVVECGEVQLFEESYD